eukprot:7599893-Pyramimonas_sp.AAC.1
MTWCHTDCDPWHATDRRLAAPGPGSPFTYEKLCPVLGAIKCKDYAEVLDMGEAVLRNGGMGHTSSLFCAEDRMDVISMFNSRMPAGRVLVDMPRCGALWSVDRGGEPNSSAVEL